MEVTIPKWLPPLCAATIALASTANVSLAKPQAKAKVQTLKGGILGRSIIIGRSRVLVVNRPVTLRRKASLAVKGGYVIINGHIDVPSGVNLPILGGTLSGKGTIHVHPGGTLTLTGVPTKTLNGIQIINEGTLRWGGTGRIHCGNGTVVKNTGTMYLSNGAKKNAAYAPTTAKFVNNGFIIDISQGKGATIHGNVSNFGTIKLNEQDCEPPLGATPTPSLVVITGTFGAVGSTFQTTINSTYYGQLYVPTPVSLGGTFQYVLSPTTLNPGAGPYDVILAGSIGASDFTAFTSVPTPFRFTHQKVLTTSPKKYQLINFTQVKP